VRSLFCREGEGGRGRREEGGRKEGGREEGRLSFNLDKKLLCINLIANFWNHTVQPHRDRLDSSAHY